jgi:predicted amino acid dehydrogenase
MESDCYGELSTTIGMAGVVSHTAQRGRDLIRVGTVVFGREGDIAVAAAARGRTQARHLRWFRDRAALSAAEVECNRLSTAALQSVRNAI